MTDKINKKLEDLEEICNDLMDYCNDLAERINILGNALLSSDDNIKMLINLFPKKDKDKETS